MFENAKTFGSLIQVPPKLAATLPNIEKRLDDVLKHGDPSHASAHVIKPLLHQARLLAKQYDAVVANPPYMGSKYFSPMFKSMAQSHFPHTKHDTFSMFMERCLRPSTARTSLGFVTPYVWMFISSYQKLREDTLSACTLTSLIQLEYNAFEPACVPVCAFTMNAYHIDTYEGDFIKLSDFKGHQNQSPRTLEAIANPACGWRFKSSWNDIRVLPGTPVAYWMSAQVRRVFATAKPICEFADARQGLATTENDRFVRRWWEVTFSGIGFGVPSRSRAVASSLKWFPYNKGGEFRKWFGNIDTIVNWEADGRDIKATIITKYPYLNGNPDYVAKNQDYYFRAGITWSDVTSSSLSFRLMDDGVIPGHVGHSAYLTDRERLMAVLALLNTPIIDRFSKLLSPTLHFDVGYFKKLPFLERVTTEASDCARRAVELARRDWNSHETSWDFNALEFVSSHGQGKLASTDYQRWVDDVQLRVQEMKRLEEENNRLFIEAYGLQGELSPEVGDDQITLYRPDCQEDTKCLLSYAIGCMMGRYVSVHGAFRILVFASESMHRVGWRYDAAGARRRDCSPKFRVAGDYHVIVTADHGFLFTETARVQTDKSKLENKPDRTILEKKRYILGPKLPDNDAAWHGKLSVTSGVDGDMEFWIPKGANIFHFVGGARFAHGGAMPQEIVVPVITVKHVRRTETKTKPVSVQVLGSNHRITSAYCRFQLIQMEPVSERVKPITLRVAVFDGDEAVTDIQTVKFDSSSGNLDDRKKWVSLVLKERQYNKKTAYRLVLRDAETGIEQQSVEVIIDRAFTDDF